VYLADIKERLVKAQEDNIKRCINSRQNRTFEVGEKVSQKNNKRLGNKFTPLCSEQKVESDLGTAVLIKGGFGPQGQPQIGGLLQLVSKSI